MHPCGSTALYKHVSLLLLELSLKTYKGTPLSGTGLALFLFIYLSALDIHCCAQAFSSYTEQRLLSRFSAKDSCGGFSFCRAQALGTATGSVVVAGQALGSNMSPLHWQMDSYLLYYQRSPRIGIFDSSVGQWQKGKFSWCKTSSHVVRDQQDLMEELGRGGDLFFLVVLIYGDFSQTSEARHRLRKCFVSSE